MWSMPEEKKIPTRKENIKYWCYITSLIIFIVVLISGFFYLLAHVPVSEHKQKSPVVQQEDEDHTLRNTLIYFYIMSEL